MEKYKEVYPHSKHCAYFAVS